MPQKKTVQAARRKKREGKSPSTQAGTHSPKQAIAIALAKARRAGVKLPAFGRKKKKTASATRGALASQVRQAARKRSPTGRRQAAMKAVRTKGRIGLRRAALKAARSRQAG